MNSYKLVEIFTSVKGEGVNTGIPMMFIRFAGCNLNCTFCDTPFETKFEKTEEQVLAVVQENKPAWIVFTGGEPSLQLTKSLVESANRLGARTALETNGIEWNDAFDLIDYVTISPKAPLRICERWYSYESRTGKTISEIRYLVEGTKLPTIRSIDSIHVCISPMFVRGRGMLVGGTDTRSLQTAIEFVQANRHLGYRLSVQVHKLIGVR